MPASSPAHAELTGAEGWWRNEPNRKGTEGTQGSDLLSPGNDAPTTGGMAGGTRTVWILGAGFSRSLGGPLLPDLLSPPTNNFVQALYARNRYIGSLDVDGPGENGKELRQDAEDVRQLYTACGGETSPRVMRLWDDAEAFLDQLDAAAHGYERARTRGEAEAPATSRLTRAMIGALGHAPRDWAALGDAARRLVAAACCAFLSDADTTEERWQPYISWAKDTDASDSIVTFNYDRVLELLGREFHVVDPSKPVEGSPSVATVFKLHGSVDWERHETSSGVQYSITSSPEHALTCPGHMVGIATPGPTKRTSVQELKPLWTQACRRIEEAQVIVFVGFRFPPSDAEAREKLLGAITANESPHVEMHVVLGPDRGHKDVVRLEQLLRYAMNKQGRDERGRGEITGPRDGIEVLTQPGKQSYALTTHALFAEDFFTVWDPHLLWPKIRFLGHGGLGAGR